MESKNQLKVPSDGLINNDIELMKQMISAYNKDDSEGVVVTLEKLIKNTAMSESEKEEHFQFLKLLKESKSKEGIENYFLLFFTRKYFAMTVRSMNIFDQKMESQRGSLEEMEQNLITKVNQLQQSLIDSTDHLLNQAKFLTNAEKEFITGLLEARKLLSPEHINAKLDTAIMQENLKGVAKEDKIEELEVKLNNVEKTLDTLNKNLNTLNTNFNNVLGNVNLNNISGNNQPQISKKDFDDLKNNVNTLLNLQKKQNTPNQTTNTKTVQQKKRTFLERLSYLFTGD